MRAQLAQERGCTGTRDSDSSCPARAAFTQRKVQWSSSLLVGGIELRAVHGEQLDDGIHRQGSEVQRSLSGIIRRVDIDVLFEQYLYRFQHLRFQRVFIRKRSESAAKSGWPLENYYGKRLALTNAPSLARPEWPFGSAWPAISSCKEREGMK